MRYIKPDYYEKFKCVAGKCPDTCCAGWQIMIDEDSLEKYAQVPGEFGDRLEASIDWEEGAFYQSGRRCAFLNKEDLCDIYAELGEEALCQTCTNYPRHTEEYEGLRELSLSLSCPIAAEMILSQEKFPVFEEYEDDREEELADEFEDFDLLMFTQLEDARAVIMKHLEEGTQSLEEKLDIYLQFAKDMQDCITREAYFEIEEVINDYKENCFVEAVEKEDRYSHMCELFGYMIKLERLRDEWDKVLAEMQSTLYGSSRELYMQHVQVFQKWLMQEPERIKQWESIGTQLFVFFLYTYFCGAVYDDWIYSKMALAVESVRFVRELYMNRWVQKRELDIADYVELAYRYAREIEHSDQNLNELEEAFMQIFS